MSEAKAEAKAEEGAPKKGKGKIIIIAVVALVLVGGGVGAFLAMGGKGEEKATEGEDGAAAAEEGEGEHGGEHEASGAIMPLEVFTVNLRIKGSFLRAGIQLEFATPELPHGADALKPKMQDAIIRVLTTKSAEEILSSEGKEQLKSELLDSINQALGHDDVTQVYFSEFIVQ